eukprot:TRINITY_DN5729_c0_g1_i1.p2 TRINITY_DN5729_c0_g1~~TRINITY_DN5729_c0_g1_i1.p2  ORF type:complete len:116 (-),score=22.09 TRINITY_DN5729_c0_g1_i1:179-526(-)
MKKTNTQTDRAKCRCCCYTWAPQLEQKRAPGVVLAPQLEQKRAPPPPPPPLVLPLELAPPLPPLAPPAPPLLLKKKSAWGSDERAAGSGARGLADPFWPTSERPPESTTERKATL